MYFKPSYLNLKSFVFLVLALLAFQSGYSKTVLKESKIANKIENIVILLLLIIIFTFFRITSTV